MTKADNDMNEGSVPPRETSGTSEASGEPKPCPACAKGNPHRCVKWSCADVIQLSEQLASERERNTVLEQKLLGCEMHIELDSPAEQVYISQVAAIAELQNKLAEYEGMDEAFKTAQKRMASLDEAIAALLKTAAEKDARIAALEFELAAARTTTQQRGEDQWGNRSSY
jgi:hypothetical protein